MKRFLKKKLKNGITVIFEPRQNGLVTLAFAVRFGSINEDEKERGLAHFMEHMSFKGTAKRTTRQISAEIEKKGGMLNAYTSEQLTAYWCKMPSQHIKTALDVLSDMILRPKFSEVELKKERYVILEEIKMYKDNPRLHVFNKILECLYKGNLATSVIGKEKTLMKINSNKMKKVHNKTYGSKNIIMAVIGEVDFKKLCEFAERTFKKKEFVVEKKKFTKVNKILIEKRKGLDQANLIFAYHLPNSTKGYFIGHLLNVILASGMSSRLWTEIRAKRNLGYAVKGYGQYYADFAFNGIYVGTKKDKVEEVKSLIIKEFEKLKKLGEKEFEDAKVELIGNIKVGLETSESTMEAIIDAERAGRLEEFYDFENQIKAIKLSELKEIVSEADKKHSFFALLPE